MYLWFTWESSNMSRQVPNWYKYYTSFRKAMLSRVLWLSEDVLVQVLVLLLVLVPVLVQMGPISEIFGSSLTLLSTGSLVCISPRDWQWTCEINPMCKRNPRKPRDKSTSSSTCGNCSWPPNRPLYDLFGLKETPKFYVWIKSFHFKVILHSWL